ncbi:IclR family transcriptional regulator [Marinovum sp.]|uniref:IclR family transcriptional regulator n=1 Tax=Marinovum sp. TaxID=2024839 RepID=UPI002B27B5BB|nr:IclR family transcriptional regulator [Marinovum sp.]
MAQRRQAEGDPAETADRYRAPALDRGLDILEVLASEVRGLTRAEICEAMGVSASQMYRMLERLIARGYVTRLDGGDRYALTMKLFLVATGHPPQRRLVAQAQPGMDAFALEQRQSVHLAIPERGSAVILAQASAISHWEFCARVGARMDLFNTGSGQTLLAFQDPARLEETLGTWGIANGAERLAPVRDALEAVRAKGYRVGASGQVVGITDLSVPIAGPNGDAVAVLTCAYLGRPGDAPGDAQREAALHSLIRLAESLSLRNPA